MMHPFSALLALVAVFPAPATQSKQAPYEELCGRLAEELALVGAPVDLSKLTIEVLPRSEFRADLESLDLLFRPVGFYQSQYLVREALGQQPGDDAAQMRADLLDKRVDAEPVHYHFVRDALVFLADDPIALREQPAAVELAVAWRDQQNDLGAAMELEARTQEATLMRAAMIYGEAEAAVRRMLDARDDAAKRLSDTQHELALRARGLDAFNERVRSEGRHFCERRRHESGGRDAMSHYWNALPASTEQMLHERKWKADNPERLALPAWPEKIEGAELQHTDTLGELGIFSVLLQAGVPRAKAFELSVGWDGDLMHLYHVEGKQKVLIWRTVWDRPHDAQQFSRIWGLRTLGEMRVGGRTVDWVFAQQQGPWKKVLVSLEQNLPKLTEGSRDGLSTSEIEEEYKRDNASMPYVIGNLWRHPKYDLTLPVPIGWYEDMERGTPFIARTASGGGFTDSVRVGARSNRAEHSLQMLLEQNRAAIDAQEERTPLVVELREIGGKEVAFMRYEGHDASHEVIYTSILFLHEDKQVAITVSVEEVRWDKLQPVIDDCLANIVFGPVQRMER